MIKFYKTDDPEINHYYGALGPRVWISWTSNYPGDTWDISVFEGPNLPYEWPEVEFSEIPSEGQEKYLEQLAGEGFDDF